MKKLKKFISAFCLTMLAWVMVDGRAEVGVGSEKGFESWWEGDGATGDWFGLRDGLAGSGVEIFGGYTVDIFGNTRGGLKRGTVYSGLLEFGAEADLEELVGWPGAKVSTTWIWLSGRDASEDLVGNFLTISNIAGFNTLRMLELWFEQSVWEERISLRLGQLAADSEFMISDHAGLFLNGTFGWPAFAYMNLPEGGPGYPMGTLGVRLAVRPTDWLTVLAGVFQGNVFAQDVNRHGFRYRLDASDGYTFLTEAQVCWGQGGALLPGQLKGGLWVQTGKLADALAEETRSGNFGFYGILDQMLFREHSGQVVEERGEGKAVADGKEASKSAAGEESEAGEQGLSGFLRVALAPEDRNFVNFYFDVGLTYQGLLPMRDEDALGVAFGYAQISGGARDGLRGEGLRPMGGEMVLEATYRIQLNPWLAVQPDLQYVINPGGTRSLGDALLVGFRGEVTF